MQGTSVRAGRDARPRTSAWRIFLLRGWGAQTVLDPGFFPFCRCWLFLFFSCFMVFSYFSYSPSPSRFFVLTLNAHGWFALSKQTLAFS